MRYAKTNSLRDDPREITARFDSVCAESGKVIKAGEQCIYYPKGKRVYHIESAQAGQFFGWLEDLAMGWDY